MSARNFSTAKFRGSSDPAPKPSSSAPSTSTGAPIINKKKVVPTILDKALSAGNLGLGIVLLTLSSFMITFFWHFKFFEKHYRAIGYFRHETKFPLLLLAIFIQNILLNFAFAATQSRFLRHFVVPGVGVFHFTVHVLGYAARSDYEGENLVILLLLESVWTTLHFSAAGVILLAVHSSAKFD